MAAGAFCHPLPDQSAPTRVRDVLVDERVLETPVAASLEASRRTPWRHAQGESCALEGKLCPMALWPSCRIEFLNITSEKLYGLQGVIIITSILGALNARIRLVIL